MPGWEYTQTQAVSCPIRREVDLYVAIRRGHDLSAAVGMNDTDRTRIEIVILELTRNILSHAEHGTITLQTITADGRSGILIEARDQGPGIPDIALALSDGYSTTATLGAGLPGVKRLMDEFAIESTVGVGTTVRAIKWVARPQPRHSTKGGGL